MKKIIALITFAGLTCFSAQQVTDLTLVTPTITNGVHTGTVSVDGDEYTAAQVSGTIADNINQYGVYAYLTAPSNTVLSVAETWYDVAGVFSNSYLSGFTITTNGLTYINGDRDFLIAGNLTIQSGASVTYIAVGVEINGTIIEASRQSRYFANSSDRGSMSFGVHAVLSSNAVIRLQIRADKTQTVNVLGFQTWAKRF